MLKRLASYYQRYAPTIKRIGDRLILAALRRLLVMLKISPILLAGARNVIIWLLVRFHAREMLNKLSPVLLERIPTELCLPYSGWLFKFLRGKLEYEFNAIAFLGLCYAFPGRYLLDQFKRYQAEIERDNDCLIMLVRRGLEPNMLHDSNTSPFTPAETYSWSLATLLEIARRNPAHTGDWMRWFSSPPPLVGGELQRLMSEQYRELERMTAPRSHPELKPSPTPSDGRLRVGLFRYNYDPSAEVDLLPGLLCAMPKHIDFHFLGFASPPKQTISNFPYTQLNEADIDRAIQEARALTLDTVIFSPPLWGSFCTAMTRLIEYRIAPTQIYYLGDVSTSGLKTLDYYLFPEALPLEIYQPAFTETLMQVKWGLAPTPPLFADLPTANVEAVDGSVTYVTNCQIGKINDVLIKHWVHILAQVPKSRLMLCPYAHADFQKRAPLLKRLINKACRAQGVESHRIIISDRAGPAAVRKLLASGQIYLDSYPYTGSFSTAEAMRIGLPSVCMAGNAYHSQLCRMAAALTGLEEEMVVYDMQNYIQRAVALGNDVDLRRRTQQKMIAAVSALSLESMNREFSTAFWDKLIQVSKQI